jgi:uncharacterized protein (DUF433 family)
MAHDAPTYAQRIIQDPDSSVARPMVRGTDVSVELVLAKLAALPDIEQLLVDVPALTVDDVSAVLAYVRDRISEPPVFVSPQNFYTEVSQRADIRRILDALAT